MKNCPHCNVPRKVCYCDKEITIIFPGIAVSKLRARQGKNGQWYTPWETREYENELALIARNQMQLQEVEAFEKDIPLSIAIAFVKKGKLTARPDIDNCIKAVLDALKGVCYHDDAQIVELLAGKANPRSKEVVGVAIRIQAKGEG
jgi:Holliday junction resolvase RusA-like endonuclease